MHRPVVILGAGPAGLACAQRCDVEHLIVDAADQVGGLASVVEESNGFLFQPALPIRYVPDPSSETAITDSILANVRQGMAYDQCELAIAPDGLPRDRDSAGVSKELLEKAGMPAKRTLAERVRSAITRPGFAAGVQRRSARLRVETFDPPQPKPVAEERRAVWNQTRLGTLDVETQELTCPGRPSVHYDHLVSTIPLPELVAHTVCVPERVRVAADLLRSSDSMTVNIGVTGSCTDRQIVYYPDPDVVFLRVVVASSLFVNLAPQGTTSLNVEVASPSDRPVARAGIIRRVLTDLIQVRMLRPSDRVLHMSVHEAPQAYPLDDDVSRQAVAEIQAWYHERGVIMAGRGGTWQRLGIELSTASGADAAARLGLALPTSDALNSTPFAGT